MFNNLFRKSCRLWDNVENSCRDGQASFREIFQCLNFPLNGLRAQSRESPVVGLLPLLEYKRSWMQYVNRMPRNRLPRAMKYYSTTGRRNHGRSLKRFLDTWDRNGSTSGPTPWKIYDDDDDDDELDRPHMTTWCKHISCWIPKAKYKYTHS
jgi:hypothetical protein